MAEEKKGKGCLFIACIILVAIVGIAIAISQSNYEIGPKATMSDIDGHWTESLLSNTFTFIPSKNIKGLVMQFDIYDSNNKLVNTVTKSIGDVKKGQQYTVTLTVDEYWKGAQVKTTVKSGTISLF